MKEYIISLVDINEFWNEIETMVNHHWAVTAFNLYQSHGYPTELNLKDLEDKNMFSPKNYLKVYMKIKGEKCKCSLCKK